MLDSLALVVGIVVVVGVFDAFRWVKLCKQDPDHHYSTGDAFASWWYERIKPFFKGGGGGGPRAAR